MFNGKALYNPQGRSGEYAKWAINFYNGLNWTETNCIDLIPLLD